MINDSAMLATSLDKFATVLGQSTAASIDLSAAVRGAEKARARRAGLLALCVAAVLVLIILGLAGTLFTIRTANAIKDCTDPSGTCARRGAASTAKAVGDLTQSDLTVSYIVGSCQLGTPTPAVFDLCLERNMTSARQGTLKVPGLP